MPRQKLTVPVASDEIRKQRKRLRMTQAELAEKAGLGLRTVQSLEVAGAEALPKQTLQPLASIFGIPRSKLTLGPEPASPHRPLMPFTLFINGTRKHIDETQELVRVLEEIFTNDTNDPLVIIAIRDGSIAIDVATTSHVIASVLLRYLAGQYQHLGVSHVVISHTAHLPFWFTMQVVKSGASFHTVNLGKKGLAIYRMEQHMGGMAASFPQ